MPELPEFMNRLNPEPKLEVKEAKHGGYTLKYQGKLFHSQINPGQEGNKIAAQIVSKTIFPRLILLGAGLGHYLQPLVDTFQGKILVVEPNPHIFRSFLDHFSLAKLNPLPLFWVGETLEQLFDRPILKKWMLSGTDIYCQSAYKSAYANFYQQFMARKSTIEGKTLLTFLPREDELAKIFVQINSWEDFLHQPANQREEATLKDGGQQGRVLFMLSEILAKSPR